METTKRLYVRRILFILMAVLATVAAPAQGSLHKTDSLRRTTAFPTWQKAIVLLATGKAVTVPQANIFLKRSSLIYRNMQGKTMEVPTRNVSTVEIGGRHYERIDSMLYWRIDTVGRNALFCCTRIDLPALRQLIINRRDFTNLEMSSEFLSATTLDPDDESIEYPLINIYYYRYNNRWVRAYDRGVYHALPKNMRQGYRIALSLPDFSWTSPESLMDLLRRITPQSSATKQE